MKRRSLCAASLCVLLATATVAPVQARMKYECWSYLDGSPDKMINVLADSRAEAEREAVSRLADVGAKNPGSAKCK